MVVPGGGRFLMREVPLHPLCNVHMNVPAAAERCTHTCGTEAGSYLRLIDSCITSLRLKDLLGPATRVKKKQNTSEQMKESGVILSSSLLLSSQELSDTTIYEP